MSKLFITEEKVIENGIEYTVEIDDEDNRCWYLGDKLHREGGPAIIDFDGDQFWYYHGKLHREDGPAIINELDEYQAWYYYDEELPEISSQEQFEQWKKLKVFS